MLSLRLEAILKLIKNGGILADVGCDHGYLACEAVKRNIVSKAYAMDVNEAPLAQAQITIAEYGFQETVIPILSDGLDHLPQDANVLVIAGMGFETFRCILENNFDKIKQLDQIIVQVNRDVNKLRKWISDNNLKIDNEHVLLDRLFYQIIVIDPKNSETLTDDEIKYGKMLHQNNSDDYSAYINHEITKKTKILNGLDVDNPKHKELVHDIKQLNKFLNKIVDDQ